MRQSFVTLSSSSTKYDERNMPDVVSNPPMKVVVRKPSLSTNIPDTGEKKKVAPIVSDPTSAVKIQI